LLIDKNKNDKKTEELIILIRKQEQDQNTIKSLKRHIKSIKKPIPYSVINLTESETEKDKQEDIETKFEPEVRAKRSKRCDSYDEPKKKI
jgi:pyruvate-formate lyase-activating enzyme